MKNNNRTKCAVLLAAGLGERFKPLSLTIPKPAMPFLGKPMICWIIEQLLSYGVEKIFINLHHLPEIIKNCVAPYSKRVEICFSFEKNILGTYGLFSKIKNELPEKFFVINSDIFMNLPFNQMDEMFDNCQKNLNTILLLRKKRKNENYTSFSINDNLVTNMGEGDFHFCGMYVAGKNFLKFANEEKKMELSDILREEIKNNCVGGFASKNWWLDLGTPQKYIESTGAILKKMVKGEFAVPKNHQLILKEGFPVLAHKDSQIARRFKINGFIVLGKSASVENGASAKNVVLFEKSRLCGSQRVENGIVYQNGVLLAKMDKRNNNG